MLKGVFYKMVFVLVALVSWIIYDRWDDITYAVGKAQHTVAKTAKGVMPKEEAKTVKSYKWTDAEGKVHYSNVKPENVDNVETTSVKTDANIMQSVSKYDVPQKKEKESGGPGVFGQIPKAVHDAKSLQKTLNQRTEKMDQQAGEMP